MNSVHCSAVRSRLDALRFSWNADSLSDSTNLACSFVPFFRVDSESKHGQRLLIAHHNNGTVHDKITRSDVDAAAGHNGMVVAAHGDLNCLAMFEPFEYSLLPIGRPKYETLNLPTAHAVLRPLKEVRTSYCVFSADGTTRKSFSPSVLPPQPVHRCYPY